MVCEPVPNVRGSLVASKLPISPIAYVKRLVTTRTHTSHQVAYATPIGSMVPMESTFP